MTLINRAGDAAGIYDKKHVVISEYEDWGHTYGGDASMIECDFGRVGCAICFDTYFDDMRREIAAARPDLVLFASMVHGGLLQPFWAYYCRAHDKRVGRIHGGGRGRGVRDRVAGRISRALHGAQAQVRPRDGLIRPPREELVPPASRENPACTARSQHTHPRPSCCSVRGTACSPLARDLEVVDLAPASAVLKWATSNRTTADVVLKAADGNVREEQIEYRSHIHRVVLTGLADDTEYTATVCRRARAMLQ